MSLAVLRRTLVTAVLVMSATASSVAIGAPTPVPDPTASITPSADYQSVDPPITAQQFAADIAKVNAGSTRQIDWSPFSWQIANSPASPSGALTQAQSAAVGIASQIPSGHINLNVNNVPPQPGYSILGIPHAQTLYHATILAGKKVNGVQQDAICYFEIVSGTPSATRDIMYGVGFSCNQPWIHGAIAAGLGGINYPSGTTVDEHPLGTTTAPEVENGFVYYGLVSATAAYSRTFEQQLENIYGYLDLYVDNPAPGDNFLGQPGGSGAYDSYSCAGADTAHVLCQIVTDPFTFVPTDNTTSCASGDACDQASGAVSDATSYAVGQAADDPATPADPNTPADDALANQGYEADPTGTLFGESGVGVPATVSLYMLPKSYARRVSAGRMSVDQATAAATAAGFQGYTCGISFRRKLSRITSYDYRANFGSRISCNVPMDYMNFRSRLVFVHQDDNPILYGSLVNEGAPTSYPQNRYSGQVTDFTFNPHLVVYMNGSVTFPAPYDPSNYSIGVAADPHSAAINHDLGKCVRDGATYRVSCTNVRSIPFGGG